MTYLSRFACGVSGLAVALSTLLLAPPATAQTAGYALDFDGVNDFVSVPLVSPPATNYTLSAWVFLRAGGTYGGVRMAVLSSTVAGDSIEFLIRSVTENPADPQYLELGRFNSFDGASSTTPVPTNTWTHVAVTVSTNKTVSYFINGSPAGTWSAGGLNMALGTAVNLGDNSGGRRFNGRLDEVQIWNRALSPAEIQTSYNRSRGGTEPDLYAYYRFDAGAGTSAADSAAAGGVANGTLNNGPVWAASTAPLLPIVYSTNDSGPGSLRDLVAAAASGATITFTTNLAGQSIQLNSTLLLNKNLTLDASALPGGINLLGNGRVLEVTAGQTVVIRSLHMRNGYDTFQGAGIYNSGNLLLEGCIIANNGSVGEGSYNPGEGGGIYNAGGLTLNQCTLTNNVANVGAAIYNKVGASLTVNNSTITGNEGNNGPGGIRNVGTLTLSNTILTDNVSMNGGGAIGNLLNSGTNATVVVSTTNDFGANSLRAAASLAASGMVVTFTTNLSGQTITLTNGEVSLNAALAIDASMLANGLTIAGNGTARLFNLGASGNVTLVGLNLTGGNVGGGAGGAIYSAGGSSLVISRCTFFGNHANEGGAILNNGSLQLENSTFSGNTGGFGGALQCRNLTTLTHCTFSANDGFYGGAIFNNATTLTVNNSIIAGNTAGGGIRDILNQSAALVFINANLVQSVTASNAAAPITGPDPFTNAPLLAALGNYGGPTRTMPPLPGSLAIDAGGDASLTTDQRGFARPVGLAPDLGAVEAVDIFLTNAVVSSSVDGAPGSLRYAIDHSRPGVASTITFDPSLAGATNVLTGGELLISNKNLTIIGPASATLTISGNQSSRVFNFAAGTTNSLTGLIICDGRGGEGASGLAGITNLVAGTAGTGGAGSNGGHGGGILNAGILTLTNCMFTGNRAGDGGQGGSGGNAEPINGAKGGEGGPGGPGGSGGAVFNQGILTLVGCTFSDNSAGVGGPGGVGGTSGAYIGGYPWPGGVGGTGGTGGAGGAIYNSGTLALVSSTFTTSTGGAGGAGGVGGVGSANKFGINSPTVGKGGTGGLGGSGGLGGGLFNTGSVSLVSCSISGNLAGTGGFGGKGGWSGVYMIGANSYRRPTEDGAAGARGAGGAGGGLRGNIGSLTNSIVALNTAASGPDISGSVTLGGYNLIGRSDGLTGLTHGVAGNIIGTPSSPINPLLGSLANNGGPTFTLALQPGSPAAAQGDNTLTGFDQRGPGFPRKVGSRVDIGALESPFTGPIISNETSGSTTHFPAAMQTVLPVRANVNPFGFVSTVTIEYGPSVQYGLATPPITIGSGAGDTAIEVPLGIPDGVTYFYRIMATNAAGVAYGANRSVSGQAITPGDTNGDGLVNQAELDAVYARYATNSPFLLLTNVAGLGGTNVSFALQGSPAGAYTVEYSTNLVNWLPLGSATPRYGFTDTNAPASPQRHYRLRYP